MTNRDQALARSWDANADTWIRAVRGRLIPSRRAGTDAAILDAIAALTPARLLDIGCGEGWLVRAACARTACAAFGIDGAVELIAAASAADPANRYLTLDYDAFVADPAQVGGDFDAVVFNYALFAEDITALLRASASRLARGGSILIQTLHPGPPGVTEDGWREEDFSAFSGGAWMAMPWYFRTLESWHSALAVAGLTLRELREPTADGRNLSLLMVCS